MISTACKFAEAKRNEWQQKMEQSLRRNAETHLTTSHRLPGEQAHTCDPTNQPQEEVALCSSATESDCVLFSTGIYECSNIPPH